MATPELTKEQRSEALEKATWCRSKRAEVKSHLKAGEMKLSEALGMDVMKRCKVIDLIASMPGYGKAKAAKLMGRIGISQARRVRGLGSRQIKSLLDYFE